MLYCFYSLRKHPVAVELNEFSKKFPDYTFLKCHIYPSLRSTDINYTETPNILLTVSENEIYELRA